MLGVLLRGPLLSGNLRFLRAKALHFPGLAYLSVSVTEAPALSTSNGAGSWGRMPRFDRARGFLKLAC